VHFDKIGNVSKKKLQEVGCAGSEISQ